ncbi:hypothetical protein CPB83DRAFT_854020 [Crepidotus variabilis]|uniref:Uncharacterized protein n=1 Tax=Crepidotus variabilis TaxID=179855 RepID=A0A9P6JPX9_9AGAR|nr:hypothetical protein CPB83DRAFT_854020 [Crepidotus variabilis]
MIYQHSKALAKYSSNTNLKNTSGWKEYEVLHEDRVFQNELQHHMISGISLISLLYGVWCLGISEGPFGMKFA